MKILLALSHPPYPVRRGNHRLIMNLIDGLSKRHEVVLVTMTLRKGDRSALREIEGTNVAVRSIPAPNRRSRAHRLFYKIRNTLLALVRGIPPEVSYAAPKAFHDLICRTAAEEKVDLILASYWHLYELPKRCRGVRLSLITHDIDFLIHKERLQRIPNRWARRWVGMGACMRERIERKAYRSYDLILALTERDADVLRELCGGAETVIMTLPLAIDLDLYCCDDFGREKDRILFLGAFDADFNRDAFLCFVREVFPVVLESRPSARLLVVGFGVDHALRSASPPQVQFMGGVSDIRPFLGRCTCMVLPLRFGGGVRIRMMEAAAIGTPVVSTPVGVRGMGLVRGRDYLEGSSPGEMAAAILRLLEDDALAIEIGENARRWAADTISMSSYPDRLDTFLHELLRSSSKSLT